MLRSLLGKRTVMVLVVIPRQVLCKISGDVGEVNTRGSAVAGVLLLQLLGFACGHGFYDVI